MNQQFYKNMALWVVILVVILLLVTMLRQDEMAPPDVGYSDFLAQVEAGQVEKITIEEGGLIEGTLTDQSEFKTHAPAVDQELVVYLRRRESASSRGRSPKAASGAR